MELEMEDVKDVNRFPIWAYAWTQKVFLFCAWNWPMMVCYEFFLSK